MKRYAKFNDEGAFVHILIKGIHSIPGDAIPVSHEQEHALLNDRDGIWRLVNGQIVKAPLPPPSLDTLKNAKLAQINVAFNQAAAALTDGYPESERLTWPVQQQEALAWEADPNAPTPYLDGLAAARGITSEEMRQKTLSQTQLFMQASQQLVGKRQRLRDLVYEAQSPEDLDEIEWV